MSFVLKRGVYYLSLQAGIIVATFLFFHAIPADPARSILGPNASEAEVRSLRAELGLDAPLSAQLAAYLGRLARLDFGRSYVDRRPVAAEVGQKLLVSTGLMGLALSLALLYVAGITGFESLTGSRIGNGLDRLWTAAPTMFAGIAVALVTVRLYPFATFSGQLDRAADVLFLLPAAFVLALYPMGILSRLIRDELRAVSREPHVNAIRAMGVPEHRVVGKFMLKKALPPFLAGLSNQIPMLFTGAFVVEVIFSVPGVGSLLVRAILQQDFPMLEALVIANGAVVILVHFLCEATYPLLDPRLRSA